MAHTGEIWLIDFQMFFGVLTRILFQSINVLNAVTAYRGVRIRG